MIVGLEDDNYCAHTPIPVEVTTASPSDWVSLQIFDTGVPKLDKEPVLYRDPNGVYKLDLSKWIKLLTLPLIEPRSYTSTPFSFTERKLLSIRFTDSNSVQQTALKYFINCSLYDGVFSPNLSPIKMWKCYPFSFKMAVSPYLGRYFINTGASPAAVPDDVDVEYNTDCCKGVYLRWLNEYGHYNYWLFKNTKIVETSGEELYRVPRNIFNSDKSSNEDTVGFELEEKMTVRGIIDRKYFHLFKSLVGSPDVYILRPDYVLGSDVAPSDWIKIIQDDVSFERDYINRSTAELEFTFSLPKPYTQTLI